MHIRWEHVAADGGYEQHPEDGVRLKAGALHGRHKIHEAQEYRHHNCDITAKGLMIARKVVQVGRRWG
jgi:hypothetical protein